VKLSKKTVYFGIISKKSVVSEFCLIMSVYWPINVKMNFKTMLFPKGSPNEIKSFTRLLDALAERH
jgi:hypothetical protein